METIAVFGCGFVGGTVADFLMSNNINVIKIDPKYYPTNDPRPDSVKRGPKGGAKTPSLRDYIKKIRR